MPHQGKERGALIRVISRSSINQWQRCPRAYYHKYLDPEGGPGLEPIDRPDYYALGIAFHEGGEILLRGGTGAAAGEAASKAAKSLSLSERWQYWCRAVALAWERTEAEEFFSTYDIISVEQDILTPLTADVTLYGRADAVLRERDTGALYVWNWKTTSDLRDWNRKFFFDIQSWTEALAVSSLLGEDVVGTLYGGVWKGPIYKGYTTSRLLGGYKTPRGDSWSPNREKGHSIKFNAWEETFPVGAGLPAWIGWLPTGVLRSHFATSTPSSPSPERAEQWIRQISRVESDIQHILGAGEQDQLDFFTQHVSDQCGECPFLDICSGRSDARTLKEDGILRDRNADHMPSVPEEEEECESD